MKQEDVISFFTQLGWELVDSVDEPTPVKTESGVVVLDAADQERANSKAIVWRRNVRSRGYTDRSGKPPEHESARFDQDRQSAGAEIAAAKLLRLRLLDGDLFGGADLESNIDVKWTHRRSGHMIVQKRSLVVGMNYLQVVGTMPRYLVVGWLPSESVDSDEYLRQNPYNSSRPAFWIPQHALLDWRLLRRGPVSGG